MYIVSCYMLILFSIQIGWVIIWMISDANPTSEQKLQGTHMRYLQIACILSRGETIGVMVGNIFIVLVCCTFAFLTRRLPENYNETKFITFCSFCSLVVLLAFSSTYFTVGDVYSRSGYSSLGLIVNATVTLVCLYAIKIYAIYYAKPEDMHVKFTSRSQRDTSFNNSRQATGTEQNVSEKQQPGITPRSIGIQHEKSSGFASQSSPTSSIHHGNVHKRDEDAASNPENMCDIKADTAPKPDPTRWNRTIPP